MEVQRVLSGDKEDASALAPVVRYISFEQYYQYCSNDIGCVWQSS